MPYQVTEQAAGMGARHHKVTLARRVTRTAAAVLRLTLRRSPRWARTLAIACLAIPGPLDELVVWPALVAYVAIRNRAEFVSVARAAWESAA